MVSESHPERRQYSRVNFNAKVDLTQNNSHFSSTIIDLSLNGILLDTPQNYELRADIPAMANIKLGDDTEISMSISLVHSSSEVLGFRCESIDVDSIGHLRRLIELNLEDDNAAERVLNELVSARKIAN